MNSKKYTGHHLDVKNSYSPPTLPLEAGCSEKTLKYTPINPVSH